MHACKARRWAAYVSSSGRAGFLPVCLCTFALSHRFNRGTDRARGRTRRQVRMGAGLPSVLVWPVTLNVSRQRVPSSVVHPASAATSRAAHVHAAVASRRHTFHAGKRGRGRSSRRRACPACAHARPVARSPPCARGVLAGATRPGTTRRGRVALVHAPWSRCAAPSMGACMVRSGWRRSVRPFWPSKAVRCPWVPPVITGRRVWCRLCRYSCWCAGSVLLLPVAGVVSCTQCGTRSLGVWVAEGRAPVCRRSALIMRTGVLRGVCARSRGYCVARSRSPCSTHGATPSRSEPHAHPYGLGSSRYMHSFAWGWRHGSGDGALLAREFQAAGFPSRAVWQVVACGAVGR